LDTGRRAACAPLARKKAKKRAKLRPLMRKASLFVLMLTVFIDLLGFGIVVPFLAVYARHYGASGWSIGVVLAIYSLMQFFFSPVWGRLSDRIGRRPVLMISLAGSCLGYLLFSFSQTLTLIFIARMIAGIAAANIGTAQAYVADATTPENRAKGMGLIGAAFGLGFIFGPPLGGFLSSVGAKMGYHQNLLPGLMASTLSLIALAVATFALPESKAPDTAVRSRVPPQFDPKVWRAVVANRPLALSFLAIFLIILAFAGMEPLVALHGPHAFGFKTMDLGLLFCFMGVIVAMIQGGVIGRLTKRFGERATAIIGAVSLTLGLIAVPSVSVVSWLYAAAVFIAIGQGLSYPSLTSVVTRVSPQQELGGMLGIQSALGSLARVLGPIYAGALYDRNAAGAFYGEAVVVILATAVMIVLLRRSVPSLERSDGTGLRAA
jgi:MFS transporter, DHA1 family, tetracycline resistance protein